MYSPVEASIPLFRAELTPPLDLCITTIRLSDEAN